MAAVEAKKGCFRSFVLHPCLWFVVCTPCVAGNIDCGCPIAAPLVLPLYIHTSKTAYATVDMYSLSVFRSVSGMLDAPVSVSF